MSKGMTDLHQHLLWGLDDGAQTEGEMQQMLQEANEQGITRIAATCHVCPGMSPFDEKLYYERLAQAQEYCRTHHLQVEVLPGAEVAWTYQTVAALREGKVPTLAGSDHVLLELWPEIAISEARRAVRSLKGAGFRPVLAHVERYHCFLWAPRAALRFREETGALFQVNASTLLRPHTWVLRRFLRIMLRKRGFDIVATDSHGNPHRPLNLLKAHKWLEKHTDALYAAQLTSFDGVFE